MIDGFLLGTIATASLIAALFFFKFWRSTRDTLFLAFAASFFVEGCNRVAFLFVSNPSEGNTWIYVIRMLSFLLIAGAILHKNYGRHR